MFVRVVIWDHLGSFGVLVGFLAGFSLCRLVFFSWLVLGPPWDSEGVFQASLVGPGPCRDRLVALPAWIRIGSSVLCYAMGVMPCSALLCHAELCPAMLLFARLCPTVMCYALL